MFQRLRDLSINRKLNLLVVLSTSISLFVAGLGIIVLDLMQLESSLVGDLRSQARLVANTVNVNLYLDSSFKSSEMADIFAVNPTILEAALFDKNGQLIKDEIGEDGEALYQRNKSVPFRPPTVLKVDSSGYQDGSLVVFEPIEYVTDERREYLGVVFIRSDLSEFWGQVASHLKFLAAVFLASFGLAYLISKRFQSLIAEPLKSLARKTAQISDSADYSLRQPKSSEDEIGELTDAFNEMLDVIEKRDLDLSSTLKSLRLREAELSLARDRAEDATQAKSEFLAHMSHEIRTPMNGIIGMTNIALKTRLTDSQREYLSAVKTSADSLLLVINEILDFSKIEAGHLELDPIPFDLEECASAALKSVALQAHLKGLELTCVVDRDVPRRLLGDPSRIRQILINLAGNALKFTKVGGVTVSLRRLRQVDGQSELECRVQDTGIGIPKERQKKVFESFTQADSSTSRHFGGTGLGLTITSLLVEMMGGKIWVESEVGEGSTFIFTVQLGAVEEAVSEAEQALAAAWAGRVVWLLCDHDRQAESLSETVAALGGRLERFRTSEELKAALPATALSEVAAVLADGDQHGGLRLLAELKELGFENTAVLLRTSNLSEEMTHYRSLGVRGHLLKPLRRQEMVELMLRWLDPTTAERLFHSEQNLRRGFSDLKVMVTDDNAINRQLARIMLEGFGCRVEEAESGERVLELLAGGESWPDILLLDIMMPGMDGFECTRHVREFEARSGRSRTPILALTAHALKGYEERCLEGDMDGYLSKPIDDDRLFEALARHTGSEAAPLPSTNGEEKPTEGKEAGSKPEEGEQVLDVEAALKRVGGNMAILKAIAQAFAGASLTQLEEVEKAAADGPAEALRFAAHTFKGTVLNFGAHKTAAVAQALEDMGASGEISQAPSLLDDLRLCYGELRAELESL